MPWWPLDVSDAEAVFAAAERVMVQWGQLDIWINNAMVSVFAPVTETTPAEYRRVTEVNYLGYVHVTRHQGAHGPYGGGALAAVGLRLFESLMPER